MQPDGRTSGIKCIHFLRLKTGDDAGQDIT
jgi:hypothetical protein